MRTIFVVCLLALPLAACAPPAAPNGDGATPAAADCSWNYEDPTRWWEICPPQNCLCKAGKRQSPIDLAGAAPAALPPLDFSQYRRARFDVAPYYFGQELQAHAPQADGERLYLVVGGERYRLVQFHFHTPCEHCVDRPELSLELHLVHQNDLGEIVAVGVRLDPGGANAAFQAFVDTIPPSGPPGGVAELDPRDLLPERRTYVRYAGSLTTPACAEGVRWHVLEQQRTVSEGQMRRFQSRYPYTARPLQNREGRPLLRGG